MYLEVSNNYEAIWERPIYVTLTKRHTNAEIAVKEGTLTLEWFWEGMTFFKIRVT